jgi:hypothetical protein
METIAVYFDDHKKTTNSNILNLKHVVCVVTTVNLKAKIDVK